MAPGLFIVTLTGESGVIVIVTGALVSDPQEFPEVTILLYIVVAVSEGGE